MSKKVAIYIIYIIWILVLFFNTIFLFLTWKNSRILGNLYYCDNSDKQYIKENIKVDYDFDYISVGLVYHGDYRIIAIKKNFISFPNIISGTETLVQIHEYEKSKIYNYFEKKAENSNKISINMLYIPFITIYIICGFLYFPIRKQLEQL